MQESDRAKIREVKTKVLKMLEERRELERQGPTSAVASAYWAGFCKRFRYLLGMAEDDFAEIRFHSYHLDGDNYQRYYFGDKEQFRREYALEAQTRGLPAEYILNEPESGFGYHYGEGRFVNSNILRFQRVVRSLYRHGIFAERANTHEVSRVLEIGAGYGGLSNPLSRLLKGSVHFIVDLPETLLFSASYLQLENPDAPLYLYDGRDFDQLIAGGDYLNYRFILVPNYALTRLRSIVYDLVINVASLQEMTSKQAEQYLDFIGTHCRGWFYSWNEDRQPLNLEMTSVTDLLKRRFSLIDITEEELLIDASPPSESILSVRGALGYLKQRARDLGLFPATRPRKRCPPFTLPTYREYLCRPLAPANTGVPPTEG